MEPESLISVTTSPTPATWIEPESVFTLSRPRTSDTSTRPESLVALTVPEALVREIRPESVLTVAAVKSLTSMRPDDRCPVTLTAFGRWTRYSITHPDLAQLVLRT